MLKTKSKVDALQLAIEEWREATAPVACVEVLTNTGVLHVLPKEFNTDRITAASDKLIEQIVAKHGLTCPVISPINKLRDQILFYVRTDKSMPYEVLISLLGEADTAVNLLASPGPDKLKTTKGTRGPTVNQCMAEMLDQDPMRMEWSAPQWVEALRAKLKRTVSVEAVKQTHTWKRRIMPARALAEADGIARYRR